MFLPLKSSKANSRDTDQSGPSLHLSEIDGLRGWAVLAVILNHYFGDAVASGFLGVDIFFVISGFVITKNLQQKSFDNWIDYLCTSPRSGKRTASAGRARAPTSRASLPRGRRKARTMARSVAAARWLPASTSGSCCFGIEPQPYVPLGAGPVGKSTSDSWVCVARRGCVSSHSPRAVARGSIAAFFHHLASSPCRCSSR